MADHIKDLVPDPSNRRAHNPRNIGMLTDAMHEVGAARSIVVDEDLLVLAGNGVIEAAAAAGITKLKIVEADGETIVAVQRKGLTPEQKRALAIYDNRTAELATWSVEQLRLDAAAGLNLQPFFTEDEQSALLALPDADEWGAAAAKLPSGEHSGYMQMTFTLSEAQVETVKSALKLALTRGPFEGTGNENRNGNALARVCQLYLDDEVHG